MEKENKKNTGENNKASGVLYHSGQQTWMDVLTISWFIGTASPIILVIVTLEGKTIGLGAITIGSPEVKFDGEVHPGIGEIIATGTLALDATKKLVSYDFTIDAKFVNHFQGTLLSY